MNTKGTLIVVDDNKGVLSAVHLLMLKHFTHLMMLNSPASLLSTLQKADHAVLLLDMNFRSGLNTGGEGIYWLREVRRRFPRIPVVLFTAYADVDLAVQGMKEGAMDFIMKPWDNERMEETLLTARDFAFREGRFKEPASRPVSADGRTPKGPAQPPMIWGESEAMQSLRRMVAKVAVTDANILITGENGTGKEMLAREIHALSGRRDREMVSVDMGAIPEGLFESELFGHVKGAFTDAKADRPGKFEAAHRSTLFMDEVGNLPLHLQAKLLAALQSRQVVRVGSNTPFPVDIRLIAATNGNLPARVAEGTFREDLLYRINTIHLELPALRQRRADIPVLARHFVARLALRYRKEGLGIDDDALRRLQAYAWPGNIRELENALEKAVILCDEDRISEKYFEGLGGNTCGKASEADAPAAAPGQDGGVSTLEEMERRMIQRAVGQCRGNLSAVAAQLGITRQTLYNKMKRYGI
jgi:DNA-binding NtrC family response regulator